MPTQKYEDLLEIWKEKYISPEKQKQVIDELKLMCKYI